MKKANKNQVLVLIGLLGVAIAVLVFYFVYKPNIEKAETKEAENKVLAEEVARLETLYNQMPEYREETQKLQSENREFEGKFPADIRYEDSIMTVQTLEDSTRTQVDSIAFGGVVAVPYTASGSEEGSTEQASSTESNTESEDSDVVIYDTTMYQVPLNISINCTYDDFKGLITYIYSRTERMSVEGVSISYNHENGELSGSMSLNTYYLLGTDKLYSEPFIPNMSMGVETIFGDTIEASDEETETETTETTETASDAATVTR
jgi:Tfp pilus assembly protein PilO